MKTITIPEAREGLSHPEQLFASDDEVIVTRRGEPVARILGRKAFWKILLNLTPDVLIPRPDTETVVETALAAFDGIGGVAGPPPP